MKQNLEEYVSDNNLTDIFLSHYELSNVGNPLWEAIKNSLFKMVITE